MAAGLTIGLLEWGAYLAPPRPPELPPEPPARLPSTDWLAESLERTRWGMTLEELKASYASETLQEEGDAGSLHE
jgi:hypothetical protein